ncbi:hypothetical protein EJB05_26462 [Eragrostis curvula]|uniref:Uncharacterized protein n=1 Tax=Eragrostis curvula TaxID=38414 RepID=A0A5J9UKJ7_9POAL|nr:hypothetical protein EJB05_26462 [Eragrostis curvula]
MVVRQMFQTEDGPCPTPPVLTLLFASAVRNVYVVCLLTTTLMVEGYGNAERPIGASCGKNLKISPCKGSCSTSRNLPLGAILLSGSTIR